jgi:integrase/recombinase XerD
VQTERAIGRFLSAAGISDGTRRGYATDLREFALWFGPSRPLEQVDVRVLADWVTELGRARPGGKLAAATIGRKLAAVRSLVRFSLGPDHVPTAALAPRRPRRLPDAPKQHEVEELVDAVAVDGPLGLRNSALVELVYSTGLRAAEAVGLDLGDVDFEQEHGHVREGKGGKDRVVPLGEEAALLVARYLRDARPQLARGAENALFISARGRRLDTST